MQSKTTLKGMTWDHPRGYASLVSACHLYEKQTQTPISWDRRSLQAFADESIESIAESYDFIVLDHPHVGLIADSHCLLPLPDVENISQVSMGGSVESYQWNSTQWAYPIDAACQMAVKRTDLIADAPTEWEAFLTDDAKQLKIVTPLLPVDAFDMMMTLVAGCGEDILPFSDTEFTSEKHGVLALKILKALFRLGPSEAVNWNPITVLEAMSTTNEFAYSPCLFGYINYARPEYKPHTLTYQDLPVFHGKTSRAGILGGAGIGVSSKTAHPKQAIAFAQWIMSESAQTGIYVQSEGQPANKLSLNKLRHNEQYAGFINEAWDTLNTAWTRPRDVWFLGFVDAVCECFPSFFLKDKKELTFLCELNSLYRHYKAKDISS